MTRGQESASRPDGSGTGLAAGGAFTATLDSAVNIAFPAISAALGVPVASIQWIVIAYILAFAVTLPVAGPLGDRHGHLRVFRAGLAVGAVAFLACGAAATLATLLVARALQGVGAGLVFGSAPALVTLSAPPERRGRSLARFTMITTGGMVAGPLLGGWLVAVWGWRAVYLARAPLALAVLWASGRWRPVPSSALAAMGEGASGGPPPPTGRGPALAGPGLVLAHGAHLLAQAALFVLWLLGPYYLVDRRGLSTRLAGVLFAATPLGWALASPVGGRLADRGLWWGAPLGLAVEALGLVAVSRLGAVSKPGVIALALGVGGLGIGLFVVPNMRDTMAALSRDRQGLAGSLVVLMRNAGVIAGAAMATRLHETRLDARLAAGLAGEPARLAAFSETVLGMAGVAALAAGLALVAPWVPRLRAPSG